MSVCLFARPSTRIPGRLGHSSAEDGEPPQQGQPTAGEGLCRTGHSQRSSQLAPPTVDSQFRHCHHRQAAEKEAVLAQQEEERADQRRKIRTEKKAAQKNVQKGAAAGEKRKAEDRWSHNSGRRRCIFQIEECVGVLLCDY